MISLQMDDETIVVPGADFSIEEPWRIPAACRPVPLRRSTDGAQPRLQTRVAIYADAANLNVVFNGEDDGVVATHLEHDAPLYQEDVVEVFLAPRDIREYFEIEVNPLGTTFDARIESPDGVRTTMRADLPWTCKGLLTAVRRTPASLDVLMRIPFASIGGTPGARWRANFFRIDRSPQGDEFSAWRPTLKNPADFHITAAFGRLHFR